MEDLVKLKVIPLLPIAVEMQFFGFLCATDHGDADQGWSAQGRRRDLERDENLVDQGRLG